jgi:uncharacterized protein
VKIKPKEFKMVMNLLHKLKTFFGFCSLILLTGCATISNQGSNLAELQSRAESGDVEAQCRLGEAYDFGHGAQQNYDEAAKWYRMAAERGNAKAQNNLGGFYQYGLGVATNYSQAVAFYKLSAAQGDLMAQSNLGYMYDYGLGIPKDKSEAVSWYRRAADQGYPDAMLNLGVSYRTGEGVERDLPRAFQWLDDARWLTQFSQNMKTKWRIRGTLDDLKQSMTREQIQEGEKLSREWSENYLKTHKQ